MQKIDGRSKSKAVAGFGERLNTAAAAKQAQLAKWQANKVDVTDQAFVDRQVARQHALALRAERESQRRVEKDAAKAQALAERKLAQESALLQAIADQESAAALKAEAAALLVAQAVQRKADRDARYAARKARK